MLRRKYKSVLLVFPDEWVMYSPTILNIITLCIKWHIKIDVIAVGTNKFRAAELNNKNITLVELGYWDKKLYKKLRIYQISKILGLWIALRKRRKINYDYVIGVDDIGYLLAKLIYKKSTYLSLELYNNIFSRIVKIIGIDELIIQTKERAEYLLEGRECKVHYLQNSPLVEKKNKIEKKMEGKGILYIGNIIENRGIEESICSIKLLGRPYFLTLKGVIDDEYRFYLEEKYRDLFKEERIIIDTKYIAQEKVVEYTESYYLGLCFYDKKLMDTEGFNYISGPSGKLFNYYEAGIPVVGVDILGLRSVDEFNAGVLVKDLTCSEIMAAIKKIEASYEEYKIGSIEASKNFNFENALNTILL